MPDNSSTEKDKHMKQLKRKMECWREVVLVVNSIILWEGSWAPALILIPTSVAFLAVWIMEPSFFSLVAYCLMALALIDYCVPMIVSKFVSTGEWTGQKERKLEEICQSLSAIILQFQNTWKFLSNARSNRPNIYYGSLIVCLILLAMIGNTINNLFLMYLVVNAILLAPGLRHKGRAESAIKFAYNYLMHRKLA